MSPATMPSRSSFAGTGEPPLSVRDGALQMSTSFFRSLTHALERRGFSPAEREELLAAAILDTPVPPTTVDRRMSVRMTPPSAAPIDPQTLGPIAQEFFRPFIKALRRYGLDDSTINTIIGEGLNADPNHP